jgi:hypothetical protein
MRLAKPEAEAGTDRTAHPGLLDKRPDEDVQQWHARRDAQLRATRAEIARTRRQEQADEDAKADARRARAGQTIDYPAVPSDPLEAFPEGPGPDRVRPATETPAVLSTRANPHSDVIVVLDPETGVLRRDRFGRALTQSDPSIDVMPSDLMAMETAQSITAEIEERLRSGDRISADEQDQYMDWLTEAVPHENRLLHAVRDGMLAQGTGPLEESDDPNRTFEPNAAMRAAADEIRDRSDRIADVTFFGKQRENEAFVQDLDANYTGGIDGYIDDRGKAVDAATTAVTDMLELEILLQQAIEQRDGALVVERPRWDETVAAVDARLADAQEAVVRTQTALLAYQDMPHAGIDTGLEADFKRAETGPANLRETVTELAWAIGGAGGPAIARKLVSAAMKAAGTGAKPSEVLNKAVELAAGGGMGIAEAANNYHRARAEALENVAREHGFDPRSPSDVAAFFLENQDVADKITRAGLVAAGANWAAGKTGRVAGEASQGLGASQLKRTTVEGVAPVILEQSLEALIEE